MIGSKLLSERILDRVYVVVLKACQILIFGLASDGGRWNWRGNLARENAPRFNRIVAVHFVFKYL